MPAASRPGLDLLHGRQVFARIADEYGVVGHVARRRHKAQWRGGCGACGRGLAARRQAIVKLVDEALRALVDTGADAHLLQKRDQPLVLAGVIIGHDLADVARVREPLALGHAQEQAAPASW